MYKFDLTFSFYFFLSFFGTRNFSLLSFGEEAEEEEEEVNRVSQVISNLF